MSEVNALIEYLDEERAWRTVEKTDSGYVLITKDKTYDLEVIGKVEAPILRIVGEDDPPKIRYVYPKR